MNGQGMDTDRIVADWLAAEAPSRAPDALRADVLAATAGTRPRSAWLARLAGHHLAAPHGDGTVAAPGLRLSPWLVVLGLLAMLAAGVALVGAQLLRTPPHPAPPPGLNGMIAFDAGGTIFLAYPDGTAARPLSVGLGHRFSPTWSPDGKLLAFLSREEPGAAMRLFVGPADGSSATDLYPDLRIVGYEFSSPSWSPDSTRLVLETTEGRAHLVVANADGSGYVRLIDEQADRFSPAWSPTGDWILFAGTPVTGQPGNVLAILRPDGSDVRVLVRQDQVAYAFQASRWSPTGDRIAYAAGAERAEDVSVVDLAGNVTVVSAAPEPERDVAWLPGGREVAFFLADADVVIAAADGSGRRSVLGPIAECGIQFSPDGRFMLAYAPGSGCQELRLTPLDDLAAWRPIDQATGVIGTPSWQRGTP